MLSLGFPPIALGYVLLLLLGSNGPLGAFLNVLGLKVVFLTFCVLAVSFIGVLPLVVRPLHAAFKSQKHNDVGGAARVCGAGEVKTFSL